MSASNTGEILKRVLGERKLNEEKIFLEKNRSQFKHEWHSLPVVSVMESITCGKSASHEQLFELRRTAIGFFSPHSSVKVYKRWTGRPKPRLQI